MLNRYLALLLLCFGFLSAAAKSADNQMQSPAEILASSPTIVDAVSNQLFHKGLVQLLLMIRGLEKSNNLMEAKLEWQAQYEHFVAALNHLHDHWTHVFSMNELSGTFLESLDDNDAYQGYLDFCKLTYTIFETIFVDKKITYGNLEAFSRDESDNIVAFVHFGDGRIVATTYKKQTPNLFIKHLPNLFRVNTAGLRRSVIVICHGLPFTGRGTLIKEDRTLEMWQSHIFWGQGENSFSTGAIPHRLSAFADKREHHDIGNAMQNSKECIPGLAHSDRLFLIVH